VEQAVEIVACDLQRPGGERCQHADVPGCFHWQRCIIPASGYYEWIARPNHKQPYYISAADGGALSFAGLRDRWRNVETREPVMSCTIIVTNQCPDATDP
jgi:putative SOS response-associated peptidase YedK